MRSAPVDSPTSSGESLPKGLFSQITPVDVQFVKPTDLDPQHVPDRFPLAKHRKSRLDLRARRSPSPRQKLAADQAKYTFLEVTGIVGDLRGKITSELVGKVADGRLQVFHLALELPQTSLRPAFGSSGSWDGIA